LRTTLAALLAALCGHALGAEPTAAEGPILEVGPATEKDVKSRTSRYGATVAVEVTPIEHWLEIEYGLTALSGAGRRSLEADILFKKPFHYSDSFEFMVGAGPTTERKLGGEGRTTAYGVEFVLDFMFWPTRRLGWYLEPSYGAGLGATRGEHTLGASGGLLLRFE
jgi:hypothetical protein